MFQNQAVQVVLMDIIKLPNTEHAYHVLVIVLTVKVLQIVTVVMMAII